MELLTKIRKGKKKQVSDDETSLLLIQYITSKVKKKRIDYSIDEIYKRILRKSIDRS